MCFGTDLIVILWNKADFSELIKTGYKRRFLKIQTLLSVKF